MVPPILIAAGAVIAAPRLILTLVIAFGRKDRREHALRALRILASKSTASGRDVKRRTGNN